MCIMVVMKTVDPAGTTTSNHWMDGMFTYASIDTGSYIVAPVVMTVEPTTGDMSYVPLSTIVSIVTAESPVLVMLNDTGMSTLAVSILSTNAVAINIT